jgi:uncharacterized damage-inducible protein DinB
MNINRKTALKTLIFSTLGLPGLANKKKAKNEFSQQFASAWKSSESYTLRLFKQMPEDKLDWKYTPESFSWRTQFVHCITFNTAQLCGRLKIENPTEAKSKIKDYWKTLSKADLEKELKEFYAWVGKIATETSPETLEKMEPYAGEDIPVWRLFYALENHIIHHKGQAICYLRLNNITPIGYIGW